MAGAGFVLRPVLIYVGLLLLVANALMLTRLVAGDIGIAEMQPHIKYFVTLQIEADLHGEPATIRSFLPADGPHQAIATEKIQSQRLEYSLTHEGPNRLAVWKARGTTGHEISVYDAIVDIRKTRYELPAGAEIPRAYPLELAVFLEPSETIQSEAPQIADQIEALLPPAEDRRIASTLRALFDFVQHEVAASDYENTLDAVTTLAWKEAFCGGKSRLLTALLRASNIPARLVGGLILTPGSKKTTHVWVEAWVNGAWVPFDALNDHFAEHPQNYMTLYHGDKALFSRTKNINFRHQFNIKKWRTSPEESLRADGGGLLNSYVLWEVFREAHISLNLLRLILLLPIGVSIVVLARNVVGLSTFGTFHPALMAVAFRETGLAWGVGLYVVLLVLGLLLRNLLDRVQLLHTPRLAILFLFVVAFMLSVTYGSIQLGALAPAHISLFPIAILTITIESFFSKSTDLGNREAFSMLLQTLAVVALIYWVIDSHFVQMVVFAFPEVLLAVAAANLALGRWMGMRWVEYRRFRWLAVNWGAPG